MDSNLKTDGWVSNQALLNSLHKWNFKMAGYICYAQYTLYHNIKYCAWSGFYF